MIPIIADLFEFVGTLLISFAALRVHHRFLNEHRVDKNVFKSMKREQQIGLFGVIILTTGFLIKVWIFLLA